MMEKDVYTLDHAEFAALSTELIESRGGLRFRAHGRSMLPTMRSGDILTVEKADASDLRTGDVVLIQAASGAVLAHRIIKRDGDSWTTCGDALYVPDEPFRADHLIGIVRSVEQDGVERGLSRAKGRLVAARLRYGMTLGGRVIRRVVRLFVTRRPVKL
jgi:signal peptidase I